jgi:hypothetical protein
MKITVNIETTAQEVREFLGLPNVKPLQEEMMKIMHKNIEKGASGFDALKLMQPLFPAQMQSMEVLQKAFWDAFAKAGIKADVLDKKNEK